MITDDVECFKIKYGNYSGLSLRFIGMFENSINNTVVT